MKACRSGVARWRREFGRLRECDKQLARISIHVAALVLSLWIGFPAASLAQKPAPSLEQLTRTSHIIFVGRVEKLRATNLKAVTPTEATTLVRVEELLDVPPSLVGLNSINVGLRESFAFAEPLCTIV